jgi:amino acid adenylation domain-containing protein
MLLSSQSGDLSKDKAIATPLERFLPQQRRAVAETNYSSPEQLDFKNADLFPQKMDWSPLEVSSLVQEPPVKCLYQYFEDRVQESPDRIAVCHQDHQLTYAELNIAANQLAHVLIDRGVKPDMPVGLCLERSVDMVVALLAVLKSGGAYLPLDPDYPLERLKYMVEDAQIPLILTQNILKSRFSGTPKDILCLDEERPLLAAQSQANPSVAVAPNHLAYIIYTSGSTGNPKGVMIEHRAVSHFVQAAITHYDITASDCLLQFGSISFDLAVEEIFTCLSAGARLQLRNDDMLGSPTRFLQSCQDWGITVLDLPTAYWHQLVANLEPTQVSLPPALRLVIIGGERVLPSLVKVWQQKVGDYPRLINSYGPTEATVVATGFWITHDANIPQDVPIGRPFSNTEVYILDTKYQPVPIGTPGELYIGGYSLARGYLNRPDLTQSKFIPHPFSSRSNARLYKTGDQVRYLPDGNLEFLGRIDNQVKIRGFRIELGEIETALLQYPGIRETTVIAQADKSADQRLIAYIVERPDQPVSEPALREFLTQILPTYMVPAAIITLEALPLTPNGKIDRQALPLTAPMGATQLKDDLTFIAPRTPLEETLARIWAEVLNLPRVSVQDAFFNLGGHSLQAIQIMTRIMNDLKVELPLSALFQSPTVEEMAKLLTQVQPGVQVPWSPLVPLQVNGTKRPFFAIHGGQGGVLFYKTLVEHLGSDQPFYALRTRGVDYPDRPHRRVEEMATCYIEAIRQVQPEGPYCIGGASFGGIVAFEMAQQLHAQGQSIEALVFFDTEGVDEVTQRLPLSQRIINTFRYLPKNGLVETLRRIQLRILKLFMGESAVEFYRETGQLPNPSSPTLEVWKTIMNVNREAADCYVPQVYPGSVTLLRAIDDSTHMWNYHTLDYGWGKYAQGGVEQYDLPGTHTGMFQEPYVQHLAQTLNALLNRNCE